MEGETQTQPTLVQLYIARIAAGRLGGNLLRALDESQITPEQMAVIGSHMPTLQRLIDTARGVGARGNGYGTPTTPLACDQVISDALRRATQGRPPAELELLGRFRREIRADMEQAEQMYSLRGRARVHSL